jgi:hypothetical protein
MTRFLFHHYQLHSSSRIHWHVRVSYTSTAYSRFSCSSDQTFFSFDFTGNTTTGSSFIHRQGVFITIYFLFYPLHCFLGKKERISNTTPSVELTLTGRQLNTTPLGLASFTIVYTREPSSDKIAFISFFVLV